MFLAAGIIRGMSVTPPAVPASVRLAAALDRPAPRPLAEVERADWERRQEAADRELERIYRLGQRAA